MAATQVSHGGKEFQWFGLFLQEIY